MKVAAHWAGYRRVGVGSLLLIQLVACTHLPGNQKAFKDFETCVAANLGVAAAGGFTLGAIGTRISNAVSADKRAAVKAGSTVAGVGAATLIGLYAWKQCAAVYSVSEVITSPGAGKTAAGVRRQPGLVMDRLSVTVAGSEDTAPVPEFAFGFYSADSGVKDVKARLRHKVEIVRFKAQDDDSLVLVDGKDQPILENGKPVRLENSASIARERLSWVSIAQDGKDDYTEDVVIQPGVVTGYKHKLQLPTRAQLPIPLPVPMRYRLTVEVASQNASDAVDFAILKAGQRPKRFGGDGK
jgi:hypothetical protein